MISGLTEFYKKGKSKYIEPISQVCERLPVEFATLLLKLMKGSDERHFKQNIVKCKNWDKLATEYGKYLLD